MDNPWLSIVGMDAGGFDNLPSDARTVLSNAATIIGPRRHLSMLPTEITAKKLVWPVPFADGLDMLMDLRTKRAVMPVVMLTSGDPFWFGAGSVVIQNLDRSEWRAIPARSCFSLGASILGWPVEQTHCIGLHAAPHTRLRPFLSAGRKILATLRDGPAVHQLAGYLAECGFGDSEITILESLGHDTQRIRQMTATKLAAHDQLDTMNIAHPVMVGLHIHGTGQALPHASGLDDSWFEHDGQITKRPVRALTLSALAPIAGEHLWDLGAGSGSVAIEWLLSGSSMRATAVEQNPVRAERLRKNAQNLGVDWLQLVAGAALDVLPDLEPPDAVFIGGGLCADLIEALWAQLATGTRIVANSVTLETDALLVQAQAQYGGDLLRFEVSSPAPIGKRRGWRAGYPITQWSVIRT